MNVPELISPKIETPVPDVTIEMERPSAAATPAAKMPVAPIEPVQATLEMERPKDLKRTSHIAAPPAPAPAPAPAPVAPASKPEKKEESNFQPERRASGRASGTFEIEVPKPIPLHAKKLGEVLIQMGKLTPEQVDEAVKYARDSGERLGRCLIRWGVVPPDVICRALSIQTGLPMTVLEDGSVPENLSKLFPLAQMIHHGFVPFDQSPTVLCIAASNPLEPEILKEFEKTSKKVIEQFLAREDQVDRQLDWLRIKFKTRSRRTLRFQRNYSAAYQFCSRQGVRSEKSILECVTVNVSEGGFLLDSPAPEISDPAEAMRKGLYINLCLKTTPEEIWSICEVRELRMNDAPGSDEANRWLMGVEIIEINPEFKKLLKDLCRLVAKR